MKPSWAFFALAIAALGAYSLDRGFYVGSRIYVDERERDRIIHHANEKLERERAEHAGDSTWLPTAEDVFPDLPSPSFRKFCLYLFVSGVHQSFGGSYSEGDIEPPCRLFDRKS
jgi:hypothetical protein